MAKQAEIDYIANIGPAGMNHALNKPYSDPRCGNYFMDLGNIFLLLPEPPARLLDLGVGTGWTSILFARKGFDVVGQDISPAMIELARQNQHSAGISNISFMISDYESLDMAEQFECAVFYDSLHHAVDEQAALCAVYRALKPGGICIAVEPGKGHHLSDGSLHAVELYGVTEKEMPSYKIMQLGRQAGFSRSQIFQRYSKSALLLDSESVSLQDRLYRFLVDFQLAARKLVGSKRLLNPGNIVVLHK